MTPEAKKRYDEKVARVEAAIALKEPDRVPMMPSAALFPMINAGYTVAEVIYDTTLESGSGTSACAPAGRSAPPRPRTEGRARPPPPGSEAGSRGSPPR